MLRVFNLEPRDFTDEAKTLISTFAEYRELPAGADETRFWEEVAQAEVIWTRLGHKIDEVFLANAPKMLVLVTPTTGLNHVDLEALAKRGTAVICLKGETDFLSNITSTAELTWGLIIELHRRIGAAHQAVVSGEWNRDKFRGLQLSGRTLGIVGMGRLGRIVADYACAFRMPVLCHTPEATPMPEGCRATPLNNLLAKSDIVSLHASYSVDSRHMIGREAFAAMKPGAMLINTARGELIDEDALLESLTTGWLGGAALDVIDNENTRAVLGIRHPLIAYAANNSNLIFTPHIGGACTDAMVATELFVARKLKTHLEELA